MAFNLVEKTYQSINWSLVQEIDSLNFILNGEEPVSAFRRDKIVSLFFYSSKYIN
jgi:hypothetical protein